MSSSSNRQGDLVGLLLFIAAVVPAFALLQWHPTMLVGFLPSVVNPVLLIVYLWVLVVSMVLWRLRGRYVWTFSDPDRLLGHRSGPSGLLIGLGFGTALVGATMLQLHPSGISVVSPNLEAGLMASMVVIIGLAVGEELLFRGYVFEQVVGRFGPVLASVALSLLFAVAHAGNPSVTFLALANVFLAGLLFSLLRVVSGGLVVPAVVHAFWNVILLHVLGLPMSGIVAESSLFRVETNGPAIFTGQLFGPEGGLAVTISLIIAVSWLIIRLRKAGSIQHSCTSRR